MVEREGNNASNVGREKGVEQPWRCTAKTVVLKWFFEGIWPFDSRRTKGKTRLSDLQTSNDFFLTSKFARGSAISCFPKYAEDVWPRPIYG